MQNITFHFTISTTKVYGDFMCPDEVHMYTGYAGPQI